VFRVYEDPIQIRPYPPPDRGYYFDLRNCDIKIIRYTLEDNGFRELPTTKDIQSGDKPPVAVMGATSGIVSKEVLKQAATVIWYVCSIKNTVYQSLQRYQKINHFPCSFYITRKDLMYKSVAKLSEVFGCKHFLFLPKTFILPNEYQYLQQEMKNDSRQWIFKPAAQSQGRGIFVTNKLSEIPHTNGNHNYVVS
jgi:tubulin polyglutamylase TTLL5